MEIKLRWKIPNVSWEIPASSFSFVENKGIVPSPGYRWSKNYLPVASKII
jgi:hypothetical protein